MKAIKRFFRVVFAILVAASYVVLLLMAWPLSGFDTDLPPYINTWFYVGVGAALILGIVVLVKLIKSFQAPAGTKDLLEQRDGGTVQIAVEALKSIAVKTALSQADVNSATADVRQAGKDAAIDLKMSIKVQNTALLDQSVKDLAERVKANISKAVVDFSGYPIANFDLKVDVDDVQAPKTGEYVHKAQTEHKSQTEHKVVKSQNSGEVSIVVEKAAETGLEKTGEEAVRQAANKQVDDSERDFVVKA